MSGNHSGEANLAQAYAVKFWEAGNLVVAMMFGLAFTVYLVIVQTPDAKSLISQFYWMLVAPAVVGNGALVFVLYRLSVQEIRVAGLITQNSDFIAAIWATFRIRWASSSSISPCTLG
jgi:hypothetical protein